MLRARYVTNCYLDLNSATVVDRFRVSSLKRLKIIMRAAEKIRLPFIDSIPQRLAHACKGLISRTSRCERQGSVYEICSVCYDKIATVAFLTATYNVLTIQHSSDYYLLRTAIIRLTNG